MSRSWHSSGLKTTTRLRHLAVVAIGAAVLIASGCGKTRTVGEGNPDIETAREFDRHPLYWLGRRFEKWDLEHVEVGGGELVTLVYGTCEIDDPDGPFGFEGGSCSPPLQLQIQPLCAHLAAVARAPIWRRRQVRGAPVGTIDSAPVLFTNHVQVKLYRGQGSDPGLPMRALRALRSLNDVAPVIDRDDPIPPAERKVLAGTRRCSP